MSMTKPLHEIEYRMSRPSSNEQRELYLVEEQPGEESPYEWLLGDATAGDGALFTREDAVEAAWAVVEILLLGTQAARLGKPQDSFEVNLSQQHLRVEVRPSRRIGR
jgi:glucose-6-phosphate 1-dehydrogenase